MNCRRTNGQNEIGAIRLLDVAAILCVATVLVVIAILGGRQIKERALRTSCRSNLRQIGDALQVYAHDNHGKLPDCLNPDFSGPQWPWDMHTNLVAALQSNGVARQMFYCPANSTMNDDRHWNFWRNDPSPIRVIGYPMLLKGIRQVPRSLWRESFGEATNSPSRSELGFDATACMDDDYLSIKGLWTDRSNHVRENSAVGGNILFLDGHVAWRDIDEMQPQFRTIGPGGFVQWNF